MVAPPPVQSGISLQCMVIWNTNIRAPPIYIQSANVSVKSISCVYVEVLYNRPQNRQMAAANALQARLHTKIGVRGKCFLVQLVQHLAVHTGGLWTFELQPIERSVIPQDRLNGEYPRGRQQLILHSERLI